MEKGKNIITNNFKGGGCIKKSIFVVIGLLIAFTGFAFAKDQLKVLVEEKEVKNNGEYILKDGKLYVSEDALKRDFGFLIYHDDSNNRVRLYDQEKINYRAKGEMFEQLSALYGPKSPDDAVYLWAEGIRRRNGAMQYFAMDTTLKAGFKKELESRRPTWVTGFSSPWVQDYKITKEKINESTWKYKVAFTAVAVGYESIWNGTLTIVKEDASWRIHSITKDFDVV